MGQKMKMRSPRLHLCPVYCAIVFACLCIYVCVCVSNKYQQLISRRCACYLCWKTKSEGICLVAKRSEKLTQLHIHDAISLSQSYSWYWLYMPHPLSRPQGPLLLKNILIRMCPRSQLAFASSLGWVLASECDHLKKDRARDSCLMVPRVSLRHNVPWKGSLISTVANIIYTMRDWSKIFSKLGSKSKPFFFRLCELFARMRCFGGYIIHPRKQVMFVANLETFVHSTHHWPVFSTFFSRGLTSPW